MTTTIQPQIIKLIEISAVAFAKSVVLITQGYIYDPLNPPEIVGSSAIIYLVLGTPSTTDIAGASEASQKALEIEQAVAEREALAAVSLTATYKAKELAKAKITEDLTAAKALVKRLQAAAR